MNKIKRCVFLVFFLIFIVGCSVSKVKFEKSYRAAKAIESALNVGVNQLDFGKLLRELDTEIALVEAKGGKEKELIQIYQAVLQLYQDSYNLWTNKDCPDDLSLLEKFSIFQLYNYDKAIVKFKETALKNRQLNTMITAQSIASKYVLETPTEWQTDFKNPDTNLCNEVVKTVEQKLWIEASKKIIEIEKITGIERNLAK